MKFSFSIPFKILTNKKLNELISKATEDGADAFFNKYKEKFNPDNNSRETLFEGDLEYSEKAFSEFFKKKKIERKTIQREILNSFYDPPEVDLNVNELFLIQDACWIKYEIDPLIHGIVENYVDYVIGTGIKVFSPVQEIQAEIDKFRRRNRLDLREREFVKGSFIDGEYFIVGFVNEKGETFLRKAHPRTITAIEPCPVDIETTFSYTQEFSEVGENGIFDGKEHTRYLQDINYENEIQSGLWTNKSQHATAFKDPTIRGTTFCKMIKLNDFDKLRGMPPLRKILKYSKMFENFIKDRMVLNHERSKVVWIKSILGRSPESTNRSRLAPRGGSILIENEGIKYRTEKANLDSSEAKEDALNLLYYIGSSVRFPIHILNQRTDQAVYASHVESTEMLTKRGWLSRTELNLNDIAGTINPGTGEFEWQKINGKTEYKYDGIIYTINSRGTHCEVTDTHDMWISKRNRKNKSHKYVYGDFHKEEMRKISKDSFKVLSTIKWDDVEINKVEAEDSYFDISPEWLMYLGFYIGDGSFSKHSLNIHVMKERKKNYLKNLYQKLDNGSFSFTENENGFYFRINDKNLSKWVERNIGDGAYEKRVPNFAKNLSKENLKYFFDGLINSDGSVDSKEGRSNITYSTRSKQLSEDIFLLALRLGYQVSLHTQKIERVSGNIRYYLKFVSSNDGTNYISKQSENISTYKYNGWVWCINVDNGLIITRKNGKIAIHGNSIKKADTPFSKMIQSGQFFYAIQFEDIYRKMLSELVKKKVLKKEYSFPNYAEDAIVMAVEHYIKNEGKGKSEEVLMAESKAIADAGLTTIKLPTEQIPISFDFEQIILQDPKEMAEVLKAHDEMGIASKHSLSVKAGYNWKIEFSRIIKYKKFMAEQDAINNPVQPTNPAVPATKGVPAVPATKIVKKSKMVKK